MKSLEIADEFLDRDALGLAELIKRGDLSALELTEIIIRRIEATDPSLNFMTTPDFDRARLRARNISSDTPFAGVPILIKDMIDVGGLARTDGSRLNAQNVPEANVAYIDGVEAAGLNILGMTNVPEFAGLVVTANEVFGATRNPWDLDYSAFTSSGGAAAAVACGAIPLAHGTDGGGSCRLPASATGLLGMKASRFRMRSGEADGGHDIVKTNQSLSRSVRDSAALLDCTEDKSGQVYAPLGRLQGPDKRRLKIGYADDISGPVPVESAVRAAQEDAVMLLQALGHEVVEVAYPITEIDTFTESYRAFFAEKTRAIGPAITQMTGKSVLESGLLTPWMGSFLEAAADFDPTEMATRRSFLDTLPEAFDRALDGLDVLLSPVSPVACPRLDEASPQDLYSHEAFVALMGRLKFTGPVNWGGHPAMSVPLGWDAALPIGSHFIAARGNDAVLYALAYELEEARPWAQRWAPHSLVAGGR
ncbi:MAG TPA: amidase [Myxococcales bacterium]|nr:amidase [Myxococcales bacterium]